MNRDDAKGYMRGNISAEDLKNAYVQGITGKEYQAQEAGTSAAPDDKVIETYDGKPIEGGPISINEFNQRYPNDNK